MIKLLLFPYVHIVLTEGGAVCYAGLSRKRAMQVYDRQIERGCWTNYQAWKGGIRVDTHAYTLRELFRRIKRH